MKLAGWKRTLLAGLVTLSVVGTPLATFSAGPAAAAPRDGCAFPVYDVWGRPICHLN
jgi:hypothetical protein